MSEKIKWIFTASMSTILGVAAIVTAALAGRNYGIQKGKAIGILEGKAIGILEGKNSSVKEHTRQLLDILTDWQKGLVNVQEGLRQAINFTKNENNKKELSGELLRSEIRLHRYKRAINALEFIEIMLEKEGSSLKDIINTIEKS